MILSLLPAKGTPRKGETMADTTKKLTRSEVLVKLLRVDHPEMCECTRCEAAAELTRLQASYDKTVKAAIVTEGNYEAEIVRLQAIVDWDRCEECGSQMQDMGGHDIEGREILECGYCDLNDKFKFQQTIISKLPKTADGVPVVPGMDVYAYHDDSEYFGDDTILCGDVNHITSGLGFKEYKGTVTISVGSDYECGNMECYSTRASAEAAKGGGESNEPRTASPALGAAVEYIEDIARGTGR